MHYSAHCMLLHLFQCKVVKKKRLSFVPDISFPLTSSFPPTSLQFLWVSWNPGNAASSQCCCTLVQDLLVWWDAGGYAFALRKSRCLAKLLHSDSLPEYTQIREEATGEKKRGPEGAQWGLKSNPRPVNSHTNSAQAHRTSPQMKLTAKTKLRTRPLPHFKSFWSKVSEN